jgi:hypothetical protein
MKTAILLTFGCTLLFIAPCLFGVFAQEPNSSPSLQVPLGLEGQVLFAPMDSRISYLIDRSGNVNHSWTSTYLPGEAVRWLGEGTLLRTIKVGMSWTGGSGGGVQKVLWDGTVTWDYRYSTSSHLSHHDVCALPNGNVLLIAWEVKTASEAIAAGRNPDKIPGGRLWPDHIIEVQPTGPTSGEIVWEWHVWDHLIQDYDSSKENYGVVGDHPELIDFNYQVYDEWYPPTSDWLHTNSIDYNAAFDQILLSVHNFDEVWVIDHSTTTQEAASHSGGLSDHGGDILYRWGNPQAYRAGAENDHVFSNQHDATWIRPGCPGAGNILVFNNGVERLYSSVDELTPPVDANGTYYLEPGSKFGPDELTWTYTGTPPSSFMAGHISGAERLASGNTLICNGESGEFFEVTPTKDKIWSYTNHFPPGGSNDVFKIVYVPPWHEPETSVVDCSGSLQWRRVHPGETVTGSFTVKNAGAAGSSLNWTVNVSSLSWGNWTFTPLSGENLTPKDSSITVHVSVIAPDENQGDFEGYLRVENRDNPSDYDTVSIILKTPLTGGHFLNDWTPFSLLHRLLMRFLPHVFSFPPRFFG